MSKTFTRATFETPKYPQRLRDQYTAPIIDTLDRKWFLVWLRSLLFWVWVDRPWPSNRRMAFTIKNEIEADGLWSPKSTVILTVLKCISGPNMVVLALTGDKLSCRQTENGINLDFQVKIDLECQNRSTPKTIRIMTLLRCISGLNLVIRAWTLLTSYRADKVKKR